MGTIWAVCKRIHVGGGGEEEGVVGRGGGRWEGRRRVSLGGGEGRWEGRRRVPLGGEEEDAIKKGGGGAVGRGEEGS